MLYGHIETMEERVDHMMRARALQDETGGFQAFIPLAFHPDNNQMRKLPAPSAADTLRVHAVARLMLRQHPAHQGVLDCDRRGRGADARSGSASTISTAPCRKRRFTTWPVRRTPEGMTTAQLTPARPRGRPRAARARHPLQHRQRDLPLAC